MLSAWNGVRLVFVFVFGVLLFLIHALSASFGPFWHVCICLFFFQPRCSLVATRLKNKMLAVGCWTRAVILHARAVLGLGNVSQCVHVYVCMHAYMYFCTCACTSRRGGPAA